MFKLCLQIYWKSKVFKCYKYIQRRENERMFYKRVKKLFKIQENVKKMCLQLRKKLECFKM